MTDMKNTEHEKQAVDKGVQDALPKDARWHRREARRLLAGKSGLTDTQKIERMQRAAKHLNAALHMAQTGEVLDV